MKIDCVIGIDPGANGGIVEYRPGWKVKAIKMPKNLNDFRDYLEHINSVCKPIIFLEKLSVRPDDVTVSGGGANMGKLYRIQKMIANYEQLKITITLLEIPFVMVHPMKWQTALKLRVAGKKSREEKADRKHRYRDIAGKMYPELSATMWNADATLLMHFGRYVLQNDVNWVLENLPDAMHDRIF